MMISNNKHSHITSALHLFTVCGVIAIAIILFAVPKSNPANNDAVNANNDYRSVPEKLIAYTETKAFYCNFDNTLLNPVAFSASRSGVSSITAFIAEKESKRIFVFDLDGKRLPDIPLDTVPLALAVADDEFICAAFQNRIDFYSIQDGNTVSSFPLAENAGNITSLAVSETVVFTVNLKGIIHRYNRETGVLEKSFGGLMKNSAAENTDEQFAGFVIYRSPITLAVSPTTGLLYAANPGKHRIEAFTPDGHWESALGWGFFSAQIDGFTACCNPVGIAVLDDGRIVTAEKAVLRVKIYKADGTLDCVVAPPKVLETKPENVPEIKKLPQRTTEQNRDFPPLFAVCDENRLLIFDPILKSVRVFEKKGTRTCSPESGFTAPFFRK
ncbi:MAG: hypothetical protein FWE67_15605 [Planctomycetaceae bacterium]|nr:hypothetical protein [Planctomycetaceae bacterium]